MSEDRVKAPKLSELVVEKRRIVKGSTPFDELEELEQLELMEMIKEAKRLRLQELIEKYRHRVNELKGQNPQSNKTGKVDVTPQIAMELAKLPEDQRMQVLQVMQMIKAVENMPPQASMLVPLLMIYSNKQAQPNNPQGNSLKDLAEALKIMADVANISRQQGNPDQNAIVSSILNKLTESTIQLYKMLAEERLRKLEERLSYNPLETTKQILSIAQEMKKLVGESASPAALTKLKELEFRTNLVMQKMQMDQQRWQMQQQLELEKWKNIGKIFEGPVGKVLESLGGATADKIRGRASNSAGIQPRITQINCPKCNKPFYVDETLDRTVCPHCGVLLQKVIEGGGTSSQMGGSGGEQQAQQPSQQ